MDKVCKVCSQWHYMHNKKKPNLYYMQTREEAVIRIIKWKIHVVSPFDICGVFLTKHPPPKKKKKKKDICGGFWTCSVSYLLCIEFLPCLF